MREDGRDEFLASWGWLRAAASLPAKPVRLAAQAASGQLFPGRCILTGVSVFNAATTVGSLNLLDGQDATGQAVVTLPLAAGAGFSGQIGTTGVLIDLGVFAAITTATITGSVYVVPLWEYPRTQPGH